MSWIVRRSLLCGYARITRSRGGSASGWAQVELPETKGPVPQLHVRVGYRPDTLVDMATLAQT